MGYINLNFKLFKLKHKFINHSIGRAFQQIIKIKIQDGISIDKLLK